VDQSTPVPNVMPPSRASSLPHLWLPPFLQYCC
jgi:hypothetical protein